MADFRTHLLGGVAAGLAASIGATILGLSSVWLAPVVAAVGALGALAPDVDHDQGRPLRYVFGAATLLIPSAILWRVHVLTDNPLVGVVSWIALALLVAFPVRWLFAHLTVHRGIFHSVPATLLFGCVAFLLAARREADVGLQAAIGGAAALGYFAHLVLDEVWAVDFNGKKLKVKVKRSFGTAIQLWAPSPFSTLLCYAALVFVAPPVYQNLRGELAEQTYDRWVFRDDAPDLLKPVTRAVRRVIHQLPDPPRRR